MVLMEGVREMCTLDDDLLWSKALDDVLSMYKAQVPRVCRALRCTEEELKAELRQGADIPGMSLNLLYKVFGMLVVQCDRLQIQPVPEMIKDCVMYVSIEELSKQKMYV